jgi:hypothetical protein
VRNFKALADGGSQGAAISTAFVESAVNEIVSRRMVKRQQMRRSRETVQPFLTVRVPRAQRRVAVAACAFDKP